MKSLTLVVVVALLSGCVSPPGKTPGQVRGLMLLSDDAEGSISVARADGTILLTQHARPGVRPYIHPIMAPDRQGELTQYRPSHHKHQTGLYWGLKRVNERDYFMNWESDYWEKISAEILESSGSRVKWQTRYHLLNEDAEAILLETQTWTFQEQAGRFVMDLTWSGKASVDVTMGKFYVGGLFLRMPWRPGIPGQVINAAGQRNAEAEGQRATWNDVGIQVDGREDLAHIAILDHPDNVDFPVAWRVDNELGVGPSRQILGDWTIPTGETAVFRYRLIVYTGAFDPALVNEGWKRFAGE